MVRPKKHLGQHFLTDHNIARKIASSIKSLPVNILEIGPGTGMLTQYLKPVFGDRLYLYEVDIESIAYLKKHFPEMQNQIIAQDFLKADLDAYPAPSAIIGNFPYNISSQIFFKILEHHERFYEIVCMIQKEVAERIVARHGNKTYGILSVLLQSRYKSEILFRVSPGVFHPPPRVDSAVIRMQMQEDIKEAFDDLKLKKLVKAAFNHRRKTLKNSLSAFSFVDGEAFQPYASLRPEQLSVDDFVKLSNLIDRD